MMKRLQEAAKDAVLEYLDQFRSTCRADLVTALFIDGSLEELWQCLPQSKWYGGVRGCRDEARKCGACYCGKFSRPGYLEKPRIVVRGIEDDDYKLAGAEIEFRDAP